MADAGRAGASRPDAPRRREGPGRARPPRGGAGGQAAESVPPASTAAEPRAQSGTERSSGSASAPAAAQAQPDLWAYRLVWGTTLLLLAFGLVMVFSASSVVGLFQENADGFYYLRQQAITAGVGLIGLFTLSRIDYARFRPWAALGVLGSIFLLLLLHVPGVGSTAGGATRWLDLGFISVQPSEVAKLAVVGLAAHLLSTKRALRGGTDRLLLPLTPIVAVVCVLILLQPDLGTTIMVAATVMGMLWIAGLSKRLWISVTGAGLGLVVLLILTSDYRRDRLLAFIDPFADPQATGFQIIQALIAIGSGGLFGVGPGRSVQKFSYLPEAHTDMIFAIIGEEFGFLGVGVVIGLFGLFAVAAWRIASQCRDPFGKYLASGALLLVVGQAVLNMGGVLGAMPLTGVPLPFVSFGRTNLLVLLAAVGVILSVARYSAVHEPLEEESGRPVHTSTRQRSNVAYLDRRRRDRRPRSPRPRHS